jgi:hypothetical protein
MPPSHSPLKGGEDGEGEFQRDASNWMQSLLLFRGEVGGGTAAVMLPAMH